MKKNTQNITKKLALVLGMHRSGTSLISRSLKIFGAEHGNNLLPFTQGNAKGHWEDQDFYVLNEEMLNSVGKTWNSALPITNDDLILLCEKGYLDKATSLVESKLANIDFFALKEPRITKLLPFWHKVFEFVPTIYYIFAIRNPISVANSLQNRSNIPIEKGLLLWYSYNAYALLTLRHKKITFVDYDSFLQDPQMQLENISTALNIKPNEQERAMFLENFLDKNLRNFNHNETQQYLNHKKYYLKFYRHLLRHLKQNYLDDDFFAVYEHDVIYNTLEQMNVNTNK